MGAPRRLGDQRYYWGIGYGADINGFGAQGDPRGAGAKNPVTYPFKCFDGVTIDKQTAGQRAWDINIDGVAQYGLYPDWIEDLRKVAGARRRRSSTTWRAVPRPTCRCGSAPRASSPTPAATPTLRQRVSPCSA